MDEGPDPPSALGVLAALMAYWGFADALNGAAAPFLAREFGLDDVAITQAFGWMSIGALGTYALARAADRVGRRRILLGSLLALSPLALASALAPDLRAFILVQLGVNGLRGVLMVVVPVMVAEALPLGRRARGQGVIGLTGALGAGSALLLVAACEHLPGSWRWGWGAAALGAVAVPFARRALPESVHFERAAALGATARARTRDLLGPRYRRRTLAAVAVGTLFPLAISSTQSWLIYFPVQHLGLEPLLVTTVVITGGSMSLVGFPIGGRLSEGWGRRPTFAVFAGLYALAAYAFYHVPADLWPHPAAGLGLAFAAMAFLSSAATVPMRAAATELFPTTLRATLSGWSAIAMAVGVVLGYFATSGLAAVLGGLAPAVSLLALAMFVAALVFLFALPESRRLELESEAEQEEPAPAALPRGADL
jgi:MFS family permease